MEEVTVAERGSFEWVFEGVVNGLLSGEHEISGMDTALSQADEANGNAEYAETFLVGLEVCRIWYEANRSTYGIASNLTSGNSRYAAINRRLVNQRKENNRFALSRRQNLLLLGYMRASGATAISKPLLDPIAMCIREIMGWPFYERSRPVTLERTYRILHKRGTGLRKKLDPEYKEKNGHDEAMILGEELFDEIHATRTVLVG
tara:strand:- start:144 stop:755 length:612 start_codon:yes stop_codon:yes gene_type:complete